MKHFHTIFLDIDDVLADFTTAALKLFRSTHLLDAWPEGVYLVSDVLGIDVRKFWHYLDAHGTNWWADLESFPWTHDLFDLCHDHAEHVCLATSHSKNRYAAAGKVLWIHDHFGAAFDSYMIGTPKHLLARPNAILIDDNGSNIGKFMLAGGDGFLFPRVWNGNRQHAANPFAHLK